MFSPVIARGRFEISRRLTGGTIPRSWHAESLHFRSYNINFARKYADKLQWPLIFSPAGTSDCVICQRLQSTDGLTAVDSMGGDLRMGCMPVITSV